MKRTVAGLFGAFTMFAITLQPTPADACGVKLIAKTPTPRQAVARSSHPSDVLVVGTASGRLTRQLSAKGHNVEVASDPSTAKRSDYGAVLTDEQHASAARAKFGDDKVIVVSDDLAADLRSVESQVARRPMRSAGDRTVVAARTDRKPIAAGPNDGVRRVATAPERQPTEVTPVANPPPAATPTVAAATPVREPSPPPRKDPEPTPTRAASIETTAKPAPAERKPAATVVTPSTQELYFGLGSASVANQVAIAKATKWLLANPDVNAVIEGHADPSGTPEGNLALSQTRAEAVRDRLVQAGVDASRLEVAAFGDTKLKYGASDGRNRRVVIAPKQ